VEVGLKVTMVCGKESMLINSSGADVEDGRLPEESL